VSSAAFYAASDARHFLGAVALVNSLRLVGHAEPIFLLDCGLEPPQRALLEREATLLEPPARLAPTLLKYAAALTRPAPVMVVCDADVVATRSLAPLIRSAGDGRVVAFADALPARFDARWGQLLGLSGLRRQTYVNGGLFVVAGERGRRVLERVSEHGPGLDPARSWIGDGVPTDPFFFLDQDVLNAVLAAEARADGVEILEHRLAPHPPFPGLRLRDEVALRCEYEDGASPFLLHHVSRKPWLANIRSNVYSRLLPRLWLAADVSLRLGPGDVPLRFRPGRVGAVDRVRANVAADLRMKTRGRLGIRRRLAQRRRG
jgi:hypothetical protein